MLQKKLVSQSPSPPPPQVLWRIKESFFDLASFHNQLQQMMDLAKMNSLSGWHQEEEHFLSLTRCVFSGSEGGEAADNFCLRVDEEQS